MAYARVEGIDEELTTVTEGDYVCFKSDIEQGGEIIRIKGTTLTLVASGNGFRGDYIGGNDYHSVDASECWVE